MNRTGATLVLLAALSSPAAFAAGPPTADARIDALESRLQKLQTDMDALRRQTADALAEAESARAELAALKAAPPRALEAPIAASPSGTANELDALAASPEAVQTAASQDVSAPADASGSSSNANAFNPAISLILNGSYSHHSLDSQAYIRSGFPLVGDGRPSANGFSLGESELSLSANIDDKLYGQITLTASSDNGNDTIGVEEAFIDTTSLPYGLSLRAGRFYSGIGYLNSHHTHTDSFFDRPLVYQAFLANQYADDGVQLRWIAPTSLFLEVGTELFRGDRYPSGGAQHGGIGARTLFAHVGGSAGSDNEWLAGVSMLKTKAAGADDGFSGDSTLYIADGTWKWAPQGNFKDGGVTVRGEYFYDDRDGTFTDPTRDLISSIWKGQRRGVYLEGVYRFNRTWDIGYRYDKLWADAHGPLASAFDPWRHSAELTWRNSEFSLIRLQLSHDKPNGNDSDNAISLQYQTSLGAHGAHKF